MEWSLVEFLEIFKYFLFKIKKQKANIENGILDWVLDICFYS